MINIVGFFRKKNTFIYLIILSINLIFIFYFNYKINLLDFNKIEYENYFITNNIPKNIDNSDILLIEKCFLINNKVIVISEKLKKNEMVLSYSLNENDEFVANNSFNIIAYSNNTLISNEKFNELESKYKAKYRIYLKKVRDYEKYVDIINDSLLYSTAINTQEAKRDIKFFNNFAKVITVIIFIMIMIIIYNIINDNHKYNKMLNLLGYTRLKILSIILIEIISLCFFSSLFAYLIYNLLKCII